MGVIHCGSFPSNISICTLKLSIKLHIRLDDNYQKTSQFRDVAMFVIVNMYKNVSYRFYRYVHFVFPYKFFRPSANG
jgi:hypothetical protein